MDKYTEELLGHEARLKIKRGVDRACDKVRPTLGAVGMSAMIDYPGLDPVECDDGVTILKSLNFRDKYENLGLKKLRKAALRTSTEGGDGTATTTVLTQALVAEAFKEIANDSSKIREVRERLSKGLEETLEQLTKLKREVTQEDIQRIAEISSLDKDVAKVIADVIKEVGVNGVVTVEKGAQLGYTSEVVKGARFDKGYVSEYFINDQDKKICELNKPFIVLIDRGVSLGDQVKSVMDSITKTGNKSVLFIADSFQGLGLASLIQSSKTVTVTDGKISKTGTYDIACVTNPYTGSRAKDFLKDIAAITGATVVSEEAGMKMDNTTIEQCGQAEKVVITKDTCTIIGGKGGNALQSRVSLVQNQIAETTSEYEKSMLEDRLACLTGGIGVIRVGAYTDTEFNAKKYKFDNAINATQAALQEGIVAGGGTALAKLNVKETMFKKALIAPLKQMAINAGMECHDVVHTVQGKALEHYQELGYDFKSKEVVNMFDAGIIDPFKVTRLALESATAIAMDLITTEVVIVNEDEDKTE